MRLRSVPVIIALVLSGWTGTAAAQPADTTAAAKKKARAAAESWLALLNDEAFGESWDEAAALFQKRIQRKDWIQKTKRLRDSVGTLSSRTLVRVQHRDSLRRAPIDGPFVLLKYRTALQTGRFEELLLTVLDSSRDTTWKVTGYQVTPLPPSTP